MNDVITLDENYSTTRRVIKADPVENPEAFAVIANAVKQSHKPEDKFETVLFLPEGEGRQGEGGLRSKGYFKVGGIIPSPLTGSTSPLTKDDTSRNPSSENKPLITVVTVVYNGEQFLEETILSVINQTYDNVEYIIIDGGSTDGTLDIIKKYEHAIDYWVSEKDKGIYDAMNKGIDLATGEWINFMNGGDVFCSTTVLKDVFLQNFNTEINLVFGKSITFYKEYEKIRYEEFNSQDEKFYLTRMPNHQAIFIRSDIYKIKKYDTTYIFYADTDYLRRCFQCSTFSESSITITRFELGGVSNFYKSFKNCKLLINDSVRLTGNMLSPYIKHTLKYVLQKILGKNFYLMVYINWILK